MISFFFYGGSHQGSPHRFILLHRTQPSTSSSLTLVTCIFSLTASISLLFGLPFFSSHGRSISSIPLPTCCFSKVFSHDFVLFCHSVNPLQHLQLSHFKLHHFSFCHWCSFHAIQHGWLHPHFVDLHFRSCGNLSVTHLSCYLPPPIPSSLHSILYFSCTISTSLYFGT